jgi:hypothetical protein
MSPPPPASGDRARSRPAPSPINPTATRAQEVRAKRDGSKAYRRPAAKPVLRRAVSGHGESPRGSALEAVGGELDRGP